MSEAHYKAEIDRLNLELIRHKQMVLQYQERELLALVAQRTHDAAADARDVPSGATKQPDAYAGS